MARPRSFDPDSVLTAAMHCFRRLGYERVTIKDLEQATGVSSGSLYNSYESKEGVFRAALDHYLATVVGARIAAFARPSANLDDLEQLFLSIWEMPQADGFGCLVTNSAVEFGPNAPEFAADKIARGLELAGNGIRSVLMRELGPEEGDREAEHLALVYHGVLVLSRSATLTPGHRQAVRETFDRLRRLAATPNK
jgi:TetR/AcrR family transcriptional regulator, transcriptional repressor for nem operon